MNANRLAVDTAHSAEVLKRQVYQIDGMLQGTSPGGGALQAVAALDKARTQDPDRDAQRHADYERFCALASDFYDTHEFDLAEAAIGNALKNAPAAGADLELCKLASATYLALDMYDPALAYQNQAIVQAPDDAGLYLQKYWMAYQLGQTTPDDRRGSNKALTNVLRITITKAEVVGDNKTLGLALDALSGLIFTYRSADTDNEARQLATRALAIDSGLENARKVVATLDAEEERRLEQQRAEEERRLEEQRAEEQRRLEQQRAEEQRRLEEQQRLERERPLRDAEAKVNVSDGPVWVVLEVDQERRRGLFISRDIVAQHPYNANFTDITWEKCSLRQWLNGSFLSSLPAQIRSRVIEVTNQNPDNSSYKTNGGNPTKDRVFLLSLDEVRKYFKSDSDRIAKFRGSAGWWWLRSPGLHRHSAANVDIDGSDGDYGYRVSDVGGGVRPALFLNLDA